MFQIINQAISVIYFTSVLSIRIDIASIFVVLKSQSSAAVADDSDTPSLRHFIPDTCWTCFVLEEAGFQQNLFKTILWSRSSFCHFPKITYMYMLHFDRLFRSRFKVYRQSVGWKSWLLIKQQVGALGSTGWRRPIGGQEKKMISFTFVVATSYCLVLYSLNQPRFCILALISINYWDYLTVWLVSSWWCMHSFKIKFGKLKMSKWYLLRFVVNG